MAETLVDQLVAKLHEGVEPGSNGNGPLPPPLSLFRAWRIFTEVIIGVSNVPDESFLLPVDQDLLEEIGLTSLQMHDGRETLNTLQGINIPPELDRAKWPKTVLDMFVKYVSHTPAAADLTAHLNHWLLTLETPDFEGVLITSEEPMQIVHQLPPPAAQTA